MPTLRRAMPTFWRWSPRYACGPSRDGDEGLHDHHGSFCGHGSRASVCGSCYAADTYALTRLDSGRLRRGIDTHVRVGCQAKAINPGIKTKSDPLFRSRDGGRKSAWRTPNGSSIAVDFVLQSRNAICYVRQTFSCGQLVTSDRGSTPEEGVNNFWIGCPFACVHVELSTRTYRT
jgi:hypothetical protein